MSEPNEVDAHAAAQEVEYGTYVAVRPIDYGGARAFNVGHPVPVSHVEEFGYLAEGLVAKVGEAPAPADVSAPVAQQGDPIVINEKG